MIIGEQPTNTKSKVETDKVSHQQNHGTKSLLSRPATTSFVQSRLIGPRKDVSSRKVTLELRNKTNQKTSSRNENDDDQVYDNRDDNDSIFEEMELMEDGGDDAGCATCADKGVKEEVTGSLKDFTKSLYEVSTACIIRDDEIDGVIGTIERSKIKPTTSIMW